MEARLKADRYGRDRGPVTEKLYLTDTYLKVFEAVVLDVIKGEAGASLVLDRSCFYPEGGGQPADRGWLDGESVVDVKEEHGTVFHRLDSNRFNKGEKVQGRIDWDRRFDHMQQHTGQHLLSQAFIRFMEAETVSFHLGGECSTIDLDVASLTAEQIYGAEDIANGIIHENRSIESCMGGEASPQGIEVRGTFPAGNRPRVVEIGDFDYSYCGGTHCRMTGEVGIIKVRRWEKVRGKARVEFYCGSRALRDYRAKNRWIFEISRELGVKDCEASPRVRGLLEEGRDLRRELKKAEQELLEAEAETLILNTEEQAGVKVITKIFTGREVKKVKALADKLAGEENMVVLFGVKGSTATLVFNRSQGLELDMRKFIKPAAEMVGGKGGGKPDKAQGGGPLTDRLDEALDEALVRLERQILE